MNQDMWCQFCGTQFETSKHEICKFCEASTPLEARLNQVEDQLKHLRTYLKNAENRRKIYRRAMKMLDLRRKTV